MKINDLKKYQNELDEKIHRKFGLTESQTRDSRVIALYDEYNEMVNASKFFKYWSVQQDCPPREKLVEEWIDCLHFMLSLAIDYDIELEVPPKLVIAPSFEDLFRRYDCMVNHLVHFYIDISDEVVRKNKLQQIFFYINKWGSALNLSEEEIVEEYQKKYKINIERQQSGEY